MQELIIFKNELKNSKPSRYKVTGIVSEMILSKEVFLKNSDINEFLKLVFEVEFKEYVMLSRTLIVARVIRILVKYSESDYLSCKKRLYKYLDSKIIASKKKNTFDGWL
ncbi:hypothetical protein [Bacillus sp. 204(2023)]|uniref:hypothetical protein n=1 Tax=Bacillus sp. 204(2023) TaxID=3096766 RepID=UPI00300B6DE3